MRRKQEVVPETSPTEALILDRGSRQEQHHNRQPYEIRVHDLEHLRPKCLEVSILLPELYGSQCTKCLGAGDSTYAGYIPCLLSESTNIVRLEIYLTCMPC